MCIAAGFWLDFELAASLFEPHLLCFDNRAAASLKERMKISYDEGLMCFAGDEMTAKEFFGAVGLKEFRS